MLLDGYLQVTGLARALALGVRLAQLERFGEALAASQPAGGTATSRVGRAAGAAPSRDS